MPMRYFQKAIPHFCPFHKAPPLEKQNNETVPSGGHRSRVTKDVARARKQVGAKIAVKNLNGI